MRRNAVKFVRSAKILRNWFDFNECLSKWTSLYMYMHSNTFKCSVQRLCIYEVLLLTNCVLWIVTTISNDNKSVLKFNGFKIEIQTFNKSAWLFELFQTSTKITRNTNKIPKKSKFHWNVKIKNLVRKWATTKIHFTAFDWGCGFVFRSFWLLAEPTWICVYLYWRVKRFAPTLPALQFKL